MGSTTTTATAGDTAITLPVFTLREIPSLPPTTTDASRPNPISNNPLYHPNSTFYISGSDVALRHAVFDLSSSPPQQPAPIAYRRAGPRKLIRFDPAAAKVAIVTCGGLCPGLNTVIRELVVGLWELYGVREIFGVRSGYRGFYAEEEEEHERLEPRKVQDWHKRGGTVLKTTRGGFDLTKIVDGIQKRGYNQVRNERFL